MNCSTYVPVSTRSLSNLDENVALDATIQELALRIGSVEVSNEGARISAFVGVLHAVGSGDHHVLIHNDVGESRRSKLLNVHYNRRLLIE